MMKSGCGCGGSTIMVSSSFASELWSSIDINYLMAEEEK